MMKSRLIAPVLLALLLAGFGLGVVWLFQLRFNAGDIYPPYSSLRADPLGAKVLYESLQAVPDLSARRFFQLSAKLEGSRQRVLLIFGVHRMNLDAMSEVDFKAVQSFMFSGGRVVVSLLPTASDEVFESHDAKSTVKKKTSARPETNAPDADFKTISLFEKDGLRLKNDALFDPEVPASRAQLTAGFAATDGLPASISWHSAAYFTNLNTSWRTIYQRGNRAVVIERAFGPGSLVLSADTYFVSNEALRRERYPALLSWLIGGHREVLFDETHLGVEEHPGVAALLRRYHLEGVLLGLLLVAGLFVWQNSVPLVPPSADEPGEGPTALVEGKESSAGVASLLRRSIAPADILSVCFAEWKSACARAPRAAARLPEIEKIMQAEQSLAPGSRRPIETWQTIRRILTERS
jgi:hypothetical protein